jgi:hypothetical protein
MPERTNDMDPTPLIKAAPEIAKGVEAVGKAIPFTGIVKRMLGPAADKLAEMWKDQIRLYRYERQLKCVEKAEKMAQDAGFTPKAVPAKILFPLLEGASFEEDERLHDMWAALLANAASSENAHLVRPAFLKIVREMAPDEAWVLNIVADSFGDVDRIADDHAPRILGEDESGRKIRISACVYALEQSGLIGPLGVDRYTTTNWGETFLKACRPPKPKP